MIKSDRIKRAEAALHEAEQALRRGSPQYVAEEWQKISDAWRELESENATDYPFAGGAL